MADIKVYGTLRTMATDGIVATADQLRDTNVGKFQEEINQELAGGMEGKQDTIEDLEQIRSLANSAVQPSVLQAAIADFITKSVDDLVNYYKKSETYTKTEVNGLIGSIKQFTYRVASSLPTASESTMYIIYLIPSSNASTQNVKDEFITIQNGSSYSWEQIGSTKIDLSGYSTTEEMNAAILSGLNNLSFLTGEKVVNLGVDEEPTANSNNLVKSGGVYEELALGTVYDVSAKNPTAGSNNDGKFESLSALLSDANLNTLIPIAIRKGGMSIKFVQSSDNKYVQYFLTKNQWSASVGDWEKMNLEEELILLERWSDLKALRDNGELLPGRFYRITDYVTTTMQNDTRSAGHPFDVIVRADSASVLNEQAWAARHDGDAYFSNSNLEAWELKYKLDNEKWSSRICTIIEDENDRYRASSLGTVDIDGQTYILWDASEFTKDYGFSFLVSLTKEEGAEMWVYHPDTGEKGENTQTLISTIIAELTDEGKGTILWMKDEFGNECPYDFKNIQFKRWLASDSDADRHGLNNRYVIADINTLPNGLSVEDDSDYIWAFTFSSDASGGEQTDFSLSSSHSVHHNVFKTCTSGLPNNVMFGNDNYSNVIGSDCKYNSWGNDCYNNSWGNSCQSNSWGNNCYHNSWGNNCQGNSWGNDCRYNSWGNNCNNNSCGNNCYNNSWGNDCRYNSWGNVCQGNSWGNNCQGNSWGNSCQSNSWGNYCSNNSWGNSCSRNSWGNYCSNNSWGNDITQSTVFDGVQYTQITTAKVKNIQVLNGLAGTSSSKVSLNFAANKSYTQVATKTSAGALKIYVPGDLS